MISCSRICVPRECNISAMSEYGKVPKGAALAAQLDKQVLGTYDFQLFPELWSTVELLEYYSGKVWRRTRFREEPELELPTTSGIYMFVVSPRSGGIIEHSYIFYVGKTKNFRDRYKHYLDEQKGEGTNPRPKVFRFLRYFSEYLEFHFTEIPESEISRAEDILKDNLTPPANTQLKILGRLKEA